MMCEVKLETLILRTSTLGLYSTLWAIVGPSCLAAAASELSPTSQLGLGVVSVALAAVCQPREYSSAASGGRGIVTMVLILSGNQSQDAQGSECTRYYVSSSIGSGTYSGERGACSNNCREPPRRIINGILQDRASRVNLVSVYSGIS
ncbi:hypothetical protein Tco_1108227 [Tanacetum coccineum]